MLLITNIKWSKNSTLFWGTRFHPLVLCGSSCTLFVFLYFLFLSFLNFLCLDKQYFQIHGNLSNPIMSFRVSFHLNCKHLWKACWRLRIYWNLTSIWLSCYAAIINCMCMLLQLLYVWCWVCANMCNLLTILLYLRYMGSYKLLCMSQRATYIFVCSLLLSVFLLKFEAYMFRDSICLVYIVYWRPLLYNFMLVSTCINKII